MVSKTRPESRPKTDPKERPRDVILQELREARAHIRKKALRGKIFNESKERIRQSWANLWIKSLIAEANILKDVEVDQLAREVEKLQEATLNPPEVNNRLERLRRIEREKYDNCSTCHEDEGEPVEA